MTADTTTALVVEDNRDLADLYSAWLDEVCDVRTAYDGDRALELIDGETDVVFLDRRMPGPSGDEVLETINERNPNCRVAMVTAVEPDFDIIDMGFDDYLVKPVAKPDLITTLERLEKRTTYDTTFDEYAALVSKMAALEAGKTETELENNDEFQRLEERVEELQRSVDSMVEEFDHEDVAAVLRDAPASPSG